jgi:hypothetical protein
MMNNPVRVHLVIPQFFWFIVCKEINWDVILCSWLLFFLWIENLICVLHSFSRWTVYLIRIPNKSGWIIHLICVLHSRWRRIVHLICVPNVSGWWFILFLF